MRALLAALAMLVFAMPASADEKPQFPGTPNGLAQTPPMGWNSWNKFGCNVNDAIIRGAADAMVSSGMKDAGYQYVVIDDCWQGARDAAGNIQPDPARFPSGMRALADYVHSKGLKFGIYSDAGTKTCGGRPGSKGYEVQDAKQYAAWGVDYLKYDWCNTEGQDAETSYLTMSQALQASGRAIVFSMCEWGTAKPWLWAKNIGNLWRTTGDISDVFAGKPPNSWSHNVLDILDQQAGLEAYSGPGHWNDPDMLEVGNGGMTDTEYRAHFSLWAMLAAPLIAGNDLANMTPETKAVLTNKDVIAIDQNPLGKQASRVAKRGLYEVWARPLSGGGTAVLLLNRFRAPHDVTVDWAALGLDPAQAMAVRDLWTHQDLPGATGSFTTSVPGHGVVMLTLRP